MEINKMSYKELTRVRHHVEYWVEEVDEYGDILNYLYQGPNKKEALKIAKAARFHDSIVRIDVEKADIYGSHADGIQEMEFEEILTIGKIGGQK